MKIVVSRYKLSPILSHMVGDRQKFRNEVYWYYHQNSNGLCWGSKDELNEQIKLWKMLRKEGKLILMKDNVKTVKVQGKTYYTFTVTPTSNGEPIDCNIDPIGAFGLDDESFMVYGFMYFFVAKHNRDVCFNWIMDTKETFE